VGGPGADPRSTAESASTATPPTSGAARHEEVRVRLVRHTARARQTAGHPDEHAQPPIRTRSRPSPTPPATLRTHTRGTLT